MRLALRGGHSTFSAVSPPAEGGGGGAGASIGSDSDVSTPSSTSSGSVLIVCQNNSLASYSTGKYEGIPASHSVVCPLGSSFTRFLLVDGSFLAFSLCTVTQPGISTIGVPASTVTGTSIGTA